MTGNGWSSSTFEVLTQNGKRWVIDMSSSRRTEAMDHAEHLISLGRHGGVRVTEMRDGWREERVVFEQIIAAQDAPLKIDPVPDAEFCTSLADYYELPARLTVGRILRAYLDKNNITMLELLFHPGHLRALDRMDKFFPSALQHGAHLQAKLTGQSKAERIDKLQTVFDQVLKRARTKDDLLPYISVMDEHGLSRVLHDVEQHVDAKFARRFVYGVLSDHLEGGAWRDKFRRAVDLAEGADGGAELAYADELMAELLDGVQAVEDIFGGFANAIDAWKAYALILDGRFDQPPRYMSDDVARLNRLFARRSLPATADVLARRIARGLGGTHPLSKNDRDANRSAFIGLVRDLTGPTGLKGGVGMAEAVILRAQTLLGDDIADLPVDTAMRQALYLVPSQAARLGLLLDLSRSRFWEKDAPAIVSQIAHLLAGLDRLSDLFPEDVAESERGDAIEALSTRLEHSALDETCRAQVGEKLRALQRVPAEEASPSAVDEKPAPAPEPEAVRPKPKNGVLELQKGDLLFEEGETGEEAYLIEDGIIEVSRNHNGETVHLAVLGQGEIIGEMSLIDRQPRMASARAVVSTRLLCISDAFLQGRMQALAKDDQVMHLLIKTLVRRLRGMARLTE